MRPKQEVSANYIGLKAIKRGGVVGEGGGGGGGVRVAWQTRRMEERNGDRDEKKNKIKTIIHNCLSAENEERPI